MFGLETLFEGANGINETVRMEMSTLREFLSNFGPIVANAVIPASLGSVLSRMLTWQQPFPALDLLGLAALSRRGSQQASPLVPRMVEQLSSPSDACVMLALRGLANCCKFGWTMSAVIEKAKKRWFFCFGY
jgi:hypothetical protein